MKIDDIYASFFRFDKTNAESIPATRRSSIDSYLLDHPEAWRFEDPTVDLTIAQQYFVILVGEEGAGKTTELEIHRESLAKDERNLVLSVDFTACSKGEDFAQTMPVYIRKRLEDSICKADLFMEYRAALLREQLGQPFHAFYPLQHEVRGDLKQWSTDAILNDKRVALASVLYEEAHPRAASALALRAAQQLSRRPYLLMDNADFLLQDVHKVARFVSQELHADTYAITTTRPEHYVPWLRGVAERRRVQTVDLLSSSQRLFRIADLRLAGARKFTEGHHPELLDTATDTENRLREAFDAIAGQQSATRLVADWHNRSVRQMLPSLVVTASAYAQRNHNESLHGVVFRTLIAHAMPESLIEIFTPEYPETPGRPPFVFLRLRIIAYLYKRRESQEWPSLEQIKQDFWDSFHVKKSDTASAIFDMDEKLDQVAGALLRVQETTREGTGRSVLLLSAGQCMMEEVLTSCDFLSWVYERSHNVRDVTTAGKTISQAKLDKAVELVRSHIVPLFMVEHPYMEKGLGYFPNRRPDHQVLVRLSKYRSMFGYYSGHWFIARLSDALKKYADQRPDRISDREALDQLTRDCERYVRNLDEVAQYIESNI